MRFKIHDYVNAKGENEFKKWSAKLQPLERGKLRERIDKLAMHGQTLYPEMLAGTKVPGIQKLKIKGKVQLRPLLCHGPVDVQKEFTMLMGAKEVGDDWSPENAPATANGKKAEVISSPTTRRKDHERVA